MRTSGKVIPITGEPDMMAALRGRADPRSSKWGLGELLNGADTKAKEQSEVIMPEESWDRLAREIRRAGVEYDAACEKQVRATAELREKTAALEELSREWVERSTKMLPTIDLTDLIEALRTAQGIAWRNDDSVLPASDVPHTGPATGEFCAD